MKYFSLTAILLFSSLAQSAPEYIWNKASVDELKKMKIHEVICQNPAGPMTSDVCKLSFNGKNLNWKIKSIELENKRTIRVTTGHQSVEIVRGNSLSEFIINKKTIDLKSLSSAKDTIEKVSSLLPKVALQSLFFNTANAAENPQPSGLEELSSTVTLLITSTTEKDVCAQGKKIVELCGNIDKSMESSVVGSSLISTLDELTKIQDPLSQKYNETLSKAASFVGPMLYKLRETYVFLKISEERIPKNSCVLKKNGTNVTVQISLNDCEKNLQEKIVGLSGATVEMLKLSDFIESVKSIFKPDVAMPEQQKLKKNQTGGAF